MFKYKEQFNLDVKHPIDLNCIRGTGPRYKQHQCHDRVLVIGNGFDLRTKIKSNFRDFIQYVVFYCALLTYRDKELFPDFEVEILDNFINSDSCPDSIKKINKELVNKKNQPEYESLKRKQIFDFVQSEFGKLLLSNLLPNIYGVIAPVKITINANGEFISSYLQTDQYGISNLELVYGLSSKINASNIFWGNISSEKYGKNLETFLFMVNKEFSDNNRINLWLDVESVIEMVITDSDELKKKYNFKFDFERDALFIESFLNGLDLFEDLLAQYLKTEEENLDKNSDEYQNFFNKIQNGFIESLKKRSHLRIEDLDISNPSIILNYNYTNVAAGLFNAQNKKPKFYYINGSLEIDDNIKVSEVNTNIVVGYTKPPYSRVNKDFTSCEKLSRRVIKNTQYVDIETILNKKIYDGTCNGHGEDWYFDLTIIGHSCGLADSDVLKPLLSSKYLKTAVILCHTIRDLISIYNNIKAMLDKEVFSELMQFSTDKVTHNLYFAVEKL